MMKPLGMVAVALLVGCAPVVRRITPPEISGSSMLLDMRPPAPPAFVAGYDFELLDSVGGNACVTTSGIQSAQYWVGNVALATVTTDPLAQQAIAAATYDALSRLDDVDSIVLTRVVATGHGSAKVCANIVGRGVRLTKAAVHAPADASE